MGYTFISGATGGIGKAFATQCAKKGYDLFLTARSIERLNDLKAELLLNNGNIKVEVFACDLTKEEQIEDMFAFSDGKNILFDRLLNVAGVDTQKAFSEYSLDKALMQVNVNANATLSITYHVLKRRAENLEILVVSSMSGVTPMPYFAIYSATKSMLTNFFTALHYELKGKNVKVTAVLPGGVYTRPDIIEEIKTQGVWGKITAKTPEYIAVKSLKALSKNKTRYVPGFFNKVLYFLMKITPCRWCERYIAHRWRTHSKDAF